MLKKILAVLAGLGAAFSAIFFVLFKEAREQRKVEEEKNENLNTNLDALKEADRAENEVKKENEELVQKAHSGNNLDAFDACNELLQK
jgi:cell shape-determining protein MreC